MRPPGSPRTGVPGRLHREAAGERPPRARPQRRGSPGPIPNPAVKPAFAESTAAQGCGRAGRRARGGRFSIARAAAEAGRARGGIRSPRGPFLRLWACARVNDSLSRLRRWYLRTAPLCASCRGWCKAPPACWGCGRRARRISFRLLPGYYSLSFSRLLGVEGLLLVGVSCA